MSANRIISKLYVYMKAGTSFDPGSLLPHSAVRVDFVVGHPDIPGGDQVGVVHAHRSEARTTLERTSGIIVAPPMHRPLKQQHIDAFKHCGVAQGDTTYDLGENLFGVHGMEWMHPENGPDY